MVVINDLSDGGGGFDHVLLRGFPGPGGVFLEGRGVNRGKLRSLLKGCQLRHSGHSHEEEGGRPSPVMGGLDDYP